MERSGSAFNPRSDSELEWITSQGWGAPPKSAPGRWQRDRPVFSMVVSAKTHLGQRDVKDNARKGDRFTLAFRRCVLLAKTL